MSVLSFNAFTTLITERKMCVQVGQVGHGLFNVIKCVSHGRLECHDNDYRAKRFIDFLRVDSKPRTTLACSARPDTSRNKVLFSTLERCKFLAAGAVSIPHKQHLRRLLVGLLSSGKVVPFPK